MNYVNLIALIIISYGLGSIPFGYIIAKSRGIDIRSHGSGNIGATNVGRTLGLKWFLITFILDAGKGYLAVSLTSLLLNEPKVGFYILAGSLAIIGHFAPVWLNFRGGKVVATSLGVLLGLLSFWFALVAVAAFLVTFLVSRQVSLGSLSAVLAVVCAKIIFGGGFNQQNFETTIFTVGLAVMVVYTHRQNIKRLQQGTEHKIQLPRSP